VIDELGGHPEHPLHPDRQELTFPDELMHLGDDQAQLGGDLGDGNEGG